VSKLKGTEIKIYKKIGRGIADLGQKKKVAFVILSYSL
jgi:hypothetical protein